MNILLTGSGGFIGRHLAVSLREAGHNVYAPRSSELNLLCPGEVDAFFNNHQVDCIVHAAAKGVRIKGDETMEEVSDANMAMFTNLHAHVSASCKMIEFGSGAEYDKRQNLDRVKESDFGKSIPVDPYGLSKYRISDIIAQDPYSVNLRLFGVYGAGESPSRFITAACISHLRNEPFRMRRNVLFDYLEVGDLCRAVNRILDKWPRHRCLNLTPPESIALADILPRVAECTGKQVDISIEQEGMGAAYTGDNSLFMEEYPDFTFTPIRQGIRQLVASLT